MLSQTGRSFPHDATKSELITLLDTEAASGRPSKEAVTRRRVMNSVVMQTKGAPPNPPLPPISQLPQPSQPLPPKVWVQHLTHHSKDKRAVYHLFPICKGVAMKHELDTLKFGVVVVNALELCDHCRRRSSPKRQNVTGRRLCVPTDQEYDNIVMEVVAGGLPEREFARKYGLNERTVTEIASSIRRGERRQPRGKLRTAKLNDDDRKTMLEVKPTTVFCCAVCSVNHLLP